MRTSPSRDRNDEIGEMAEAVQVFKDNALRIRKNGKRAGGSPSPRRRGNSAGFAKQLAKDFETSVGGCVDSVGASATQIKGSASGLSESADQTSRRLTRVNEATEQSSKKRSNGRLRRRRIGRIDF